MTARRGRVARPRHRNVIWLVILVIVGLLALALSYGPKLNEGVVTCEGEECLEAGHYHADLIVTVCGQKQDLGVESGKLSGHHTHKERNKVHWHSTRELDSELTVQMLLIDLGIELPTSCSGQTAKVNVLVNGASATTSQPWVDGDTVVVSVE